MNDNDPKLPNNGWWIVAVFIIAMIIVMLVMAVTASAEEIAGRASVIDGDTIEIHGERIRLWGIDAPEGKQRCVKGGKLWRACGTDSSNALAGFLGAQTITCTDKGKDPYKRLVATCEDGGQDVGSWLVRQGWALDFIRYSNGAYGPEQTEAEREGLGLWQGEFEPPWEWRKS